MDQGSRWGAGVAVAAALAVLTGCGAPLPRGVADEPIYGPAVLSDWIEIEGRWDVTFADGEGGALLQPAVDPGWLDDGTIDLRDADGAMWVDVATGEEIWSRTDLSDVVFHDKDATSLIAFAGEGADRTLDAVDLEAGESMWSIREGDLGSCKGWYSIGTRELETNNGDDGTDESSEDETQSVPLLAAPQHCTPSNRTLLAQVDPETSEVTPLLDGSGNLEVMWATDEVVAVLTWSTKRATVQVVDVDAAKVTATITMSAPELIEATGGTATSTTILSDVAYVELSGAVDGNVWMVLKTRGNDGFDRTWGQVLVDTDEGTAKPKNTLECTYGGDADGWWHTWSAGEDLCVTLGLGDAAATVTHGDEQWSLPISGDEPNWVFATCAVGEHEDQPQDLVIVPSADAALVAYDMTTGEQAWSLPSEDPGTRIAAASRASSNRLVVLGDDGAGVQTVRVLRLCTGELIREQEVVGALGDAHYLSARGDVLTIPLESTTLLARYIDRGTEPDEEGSADT